MIQEFKLNIKNYFGSQSLSFYNSSIFHQIQSVEDLLLNSVDTSNVHVKHGRPCSSPELSYHCSYSRYLISFNGTVNTSIITVPVMRCANCQGYHAILPSQLIIPYSSYSIFFVLMVVAYKKYSSRKVDDLLSLFQISAPTLYRWLNKFRSYFRYFNQLRHRYHMCFFIHLIYDYESIIDDIYSIGLTTLFQFDRRLFPPVT